jgi:hypothetical protein
MWARDRDLQVERVACLHHAVDGAGEPWTAVSFWDRSGDRRHGSSTTVLCRGAVSLDEMLARFRERLPGLWARIAGAGPIVGHPAPRLRVAASPYRIAAPAPVLQAPGVDLDAVADAVELEAVVVVPPRRAVR